MTKPRTSTTRELFGILGSLENTSAVLKAWNHAFSEGGIDAFMDRYPTTKENLPERLSEMFHFDRRGYVIGAALQEEIIPLLDDTDGSDRVNTVWNDGGVMKGLWIDENGEKTDGKRWQLWLG